VDTSRSNGVCVEQAGKVFTPNAVIPGAGPGAAFRPVVLFAEDGSYTLEILNRYGEVIFATADPDAAWDGTLDGEAVPGGSYLYIVRFRARNGRDIVQRGTVTVVR
jgi:gliding motility-associated-like protein